MNFCFYSFTGTALIIAHCLISIFIGSIFHLLAATSIGKNCEEIADYCKAKQPCANGLCKLSAKRSSSVFSVSKPSPNIDETNPEAGCCSQSTIATQVKMSNLARATTTSTSASVPLRMWAKNAIASETVRRLTVTEITASA